MGLSLPLHLKHTQTSYLLAVVCVFILPFLTIINYFLICRIFKKPSVINWYRCASESGIVAYMLALLTFEFRIMHLVLLVTCVSYIFMDKVILLMMKCFRLNEHGINLNDDKMSRFKTVGQLL